MMLQANWTLNRNTRKKTKERINVQFSNVFFLYFCVINLCFVFYFSLPVYTCLVFLLRQFLLIQPYSISTHIHTNMLGKRGWVNYFLWKCISWISTLLEDIFIFICPIVRKALKITFHVNMKFWEVFLNAVPSFEQNNLGSSILIKIFFINPCLHALYFRKPYFANCWYCFSFFSYMWSIEKSMKNLIICTSLKYKFSKRYI